MPSLLIATSRYTYNHPLYSRNRAMVEYLQRKQRVGFSKVTLLYPDEHVNGESPVSRTLDGGVEELRFSLEPLRGAHPGIEPGYAAVRILSHFRRKRLKYDYCVAADLTGWQIAYPLRLLGHISHLTYDDQDYFPRVIGSTYGRIVSIGLEKLIAQTADGIISVSDTLAELRKHQGARNVHVVPNGIDPKFLNYPLPEAKERLRRKIVLYTGYLDRQHGVDKLVEAFALLREKTEATLTVVGTGPLEGDLRRLAQTASFKLNIRFLGRVARERIPEVMSESAVGVAPYRDDSAISYGDSLKIKEYLGMGLPVVSTKAGEIPHFLAGHRVGSIVEARADRLSEAIMQILSLDESSYAEMSSAARSLGEAYSWDRLYEEYFQILCS